MRIEWKLMSQQIICSGCGAPHVISEAFARVFACGYCGVVSKVEGGTLSVVGTSTVLSAGQGLFSIGMRCTFRGDDYVVLGRLRYHHAVGVWDEWQLMGAGRRLWVQQDEGRLVVFDYEERLVSYPPVESLEAGQQVSFGEMRIFVSEIGEGVIAGISGEIPRDVAIGQGFYFVDGLSDGSAISVEYYYREVFLWRGTVALPEEFRSHAV